MGVGLAPALEDLEPAMLFQNVMAPHPVARQAGMYRLRMFFGEFSAAAGYKAAGAEFRLVFSPCGMFPSAGGRRGWLETH